MKKTSFLTLESEYMIDDYFVEEKQGYEVEIVPWMKTILYKLTFGSFTYWNVVEAKSGQKVANIQKPGTREQTISIARDQLNNLSEKQKQIAINFIKENY